MTVVSEVNCIIHRGTIYQSLMSIANKAGNAAFLLIGKRAWGVIVNIFVMGVLGRELSKADFGILAVSGLLIQFIAILGISGISEYVIFYQGKDERKVVNAAFWLNLLITLGITAVIAILARFWAVLYADPRIANIIYLLVISFFFTMMSSIPVALFRKHLNYRPLVTVQVIFNTLANIGKVGLALTGFGVYSLALPMALIAPMSALCMFWVSKFRPELSLGLRYWKEIFQYTKFVIGSRVMSKLSGEGDTLLIGKLLGMGYLGVYNIAYQSADLFRSYVVPIISNVSMPVFARNAKNKELVKEQFFHMLKLISFVSFPALTCLFLLAEPFLLGWYGDKWTDAVLPFQILLVFAVLRTISSPTAGLYNALGQPRIGFYYNLVFAPIFLLAIWLSAPGGLVWICVVVTVLRVIGSLTHVLITSRMLGFSIWEYFRNILDSSLAAFGAAVLTYLVKTEADIVNYYFQLISFGSFYLLSFLGIYYLLFRKGFEEISAILLKLLPQGIRKTFGLIPG